MDRLYYPTINTIDDVLPYVQHRPEFGINQRDEYTVICYNVQMPDTFNIIHGDEHGSLIRRECRGIAFNNKTGAIVSRPFEKFFNLNEKPETNIDVVDLSESHLVMEKVDGSMIRIFSVEPGGELKFGTKRGETDISADAERYARNVLGTEFLDWNRTVVDCGFTPIYEWVAPQNRIVIDYDIEQLVLLAVRENITGRYLSDLRQFGFPPCVPRPDVLSIGNTMNDMVNAVRGFTDKEGIVLYFPEKNKRIKVKSDWYVSAHRAKELISQDRHLILAELNNTLDDIIPLLTSDLVIKTQQKIEQFWKRVENRAVELDHMMVFLRDNYCGEHGFDKKRISLEYMPEKSDITKSALYTMMNTGTSSFDFIIQQVRKYAERSESAYQNFYKNWLEDSKNEYSI